ncbi:type IV toxin-antitoxin system AbiEi family antitoxin domain-containing protein [Actinomycetospora chiangmaiensis]|uniref:type IV toxin-antitoxin system AbiEi family antitoxin domain-containing protein n=1 Tax=Actinomycetospora chiangmaiensis TaxID=402650 RepID=UPI000367172B|nr:type IV toxin-antitoxin system AbiEi family antitoxin domain-containing protein [Actinomycetospora chiangmaiensis]
MDENPEYWQRLRREQENVASVQQALAQGITENAIRAHVAAGRWVPLFRGVLALVSGEPTASMWRRAALLFVRGPALLSHASAAAVHRMPGASDVGPIHVTVPYGSSARGCPGITVHRSRAFAHLAAAGVDPPVTGRIVTLVDLAVQRDDARGAMRFMTAGASASRLPGADIRKTLELRPPRRYRDALLAAAELLESGVQSVLEADYVTDVEAPHGLPPATRQVRRRTEAGTFVEDAEYDLPLGTLTVRLDGWATHRTRRTAYRDRKRDNVAELEGRARLVFGTEEVWTETCGTARVVARRMRQLGWQGTLVRCRACEHLPWP